jgi:hypothetical protein
MSLVYRYGGGAGSGGLHTLFGGAAAFRTWSRILDGVLLAAAAFFFIRGWRLGARADKSEAPLYLALVIMTSVFVQPLAWVTYYVVTAFPYMAVFGASRRAAPGVRAVALALAVAAALAHTLATDAWGARVRLLLYDYKVVAWAAAALYAAVIVLLAARRGTAPRGFEDKAAAARAA